MSFTRLILDRQDFGRLVRGEQVRDGDVAVLLEDIGFPAMATELERAIQGVVSVASPAERKATATTLLRAWHDAETAVQAAPTDAALEEARQAGEALRKWCRQAFGEGDHGNEHEPTEGTEG